MGPAHAAHAFPKVTIAASFVQPFLELKRERNTCLLAHAFMGSRAGTKPSTAELMRDTRHPESRRTNAFGRLCDFGHYHRRIDPAGSVFSSRAVEATEERKPCKYP